MACAPRAGGGAGHGWGPERASGYVEVSWAVGVGRFRPRFGSATRGRSFNMLCMLLIVVRGDLMVDRERVWRRNGLHGSERL